jgi:hypothetical protein
MGKYEPLSQFLRNQSHDEIRMSFEQIERVIGGNLPRSAKEHRAWWSNNPSNSVMTKAWLDAGFRSEQVDMEGRKLVFRRARASSAAGNRTANDDDPSRRRHPLIGALKGTVWIAPGTDLTQPADPEWGEVAYGDKVWDEKA